MDLYFYISVYGYLYPSVSSVSEFKTLTQTVFDLGNRFVARCAFFDNISIIITMQYVRTENASGDTVYPYVL